MAANYDMSRIDKMEGHEFERFVASLLRKLNYQKVEVTPGSGDQGVDVLAEKEGVRYAIQCKCYSSDLGNTPVQEINTGKTIYHCHVGIVVTNRYFTQGARDAAKATGVLLWDRSKLMTLIAQTGMEVSTEIPKQQRAETLELWNGNPLLKRGEIALKDKDWKKARQFFERVLNSDPENAEAYLGLVMAEAELSGKYEFEMTYICNLMKLSQLNQNNLRHAKEFGSKELRAWFRKLEEQQKDAEIRQEEKKITKEQEHKGLILAYMSANPELIVTADRMYKVLCTAYPGEIWSHVKAELLLNALNRDGMLIRVREEERKRIGGRTYYVHAAFMLSEAERFRLKVQEDIVAYLFVNSKFAATPHDIMEKVLMPAYPNEQWSKMKTEDLLNALCDKEGKLTRVKGNSGDDAFMLSKAEYRRQDEARAKKRAAIEAEQAMLQEEISNLKGLFTGRRRREIKARLKEIEQELAKLTASLKDMH